MVWPGYGAVLAIVVHSALWLLLLNIMAGFAPVPSIYTDTGKNLSMPGSAITLEILIPASAGYIISGLKIGWVRGWRAFTSAETVFGSIGGKGGIGKTYHCKMGPTVKEYGLYAENKKFV